MQFTPLHDRVLIRRIEGEEKTKGGLIVPDTAREKPSEGEVMAVGPNAGRFEIHESTEIGGVMRMRPLAQGLEIKPGETVELRPGGHHVMFMDLREGLKQGQSVKGILQFEKAGSVEVEYRVAPVGGGGGGHSHH